MIFRGSFCSPNLVKHFFCHMRAVVRLSCLDSELTEFIVTAISVSGLIGTFLLIILIYVFIVTTVLRIPSAESKQKSFLPVPPTSQWSSSTLVLHLLFIWSQKHQGEMTQWSQFPTLSSLLSSALSFSASGIRTWRMLSERPLERNFLNNLVLSLHNWVFTDVSEAFTLKYLEKPIPRGWHMGTKCLRLGPEPWQAFS